MSTIDYNPSSIKVFKMINNRLFMENIQSIIVGKIIKFVVGKYTDQILKTWLLRKNLLEREFNHQEHRKNSDI